MYASVHLSNGAFFVRMRSTGSAAIKGFTHGRITFDPIAETVCFAHHPPLPLPSFAEVVKKDAILSFILLSPDGSTHRQRREVRILEGKDGRLFAPGVFHNSSENSKEDGWRTRTLKFRAYFTHPGVESEDGTTPDCTELPPWLQNSIDRQRRFRNRLVRLCLDARHACCPVNHEEFTCFVKETVLAAVDNFNNSLDRVQDRISTKSLRENPSIFLLRRFGAFLEALEQNGHPVPAGLARQVFAFTKELKVDFTPIRQFERTLDVIVRQERYLEDLSLIERKDDDGQVWVQRVYRRLTDPIEIESRRSELELRRWEWEPIAAEFKSVLKRRKNMGLPFDQGWPRPSAAPSTKWGIHYNLHNGGSDPSLLTGKGIPGLRLEASVSPNVSGRKWKANARRARRELNPVRVSFRDSLAKQKFTFRFVVLRHQFPLPAGTLIKEWKLIHDQSGLWLCFVVEGKFAKQASSTGVTGAVHIGWRKEGSELWPAMVFDPTFKNQLAFHRIVIDLEHPPERSDEHTPFRINMGPSREGRRSPYWINGSKPHLPAKAGAEGAVQVQDTWAGIEWLCKWRDESKDIFKLLLLNSLHPMPKGLQNAGVRTLHVIGQCLKDPILLNAYNAWAVEDKEIRNLMTRFSARIASRLNDGYARVAHDICRLFSEHGVSTIAIQDPLLSEISRKRKSYDAEKNAIQERSRTNRQRLAPGQLLRKLSSVADRYGLTLTRVESAYISRAHNNEDRECNHINPPSAKRLIICERCEKVYDQDENACRNMIRDRTILQ